jgi:tetratricopeptide (TPR) repeat protein
MNPYEVLQIKPEASAEEIMAAYLRLAQHWHPDRYTGAEKLEAAMRYRELAEAFTKLKGVGRPQGQPSQSQPAAPATPPSPFATQGFAPGIELSPSVASASSAPAPPAPFESQKIRVQTEAEIAESAPRSEQTLSTKAKSAFENGQHQSALDMITEAIRLDPETYENYVLQVKILDAMEGDKRALVQALEHCLRLNKKDADSAIHLAQIYQSMGMQTRATRYWEWAYNLEPKHPFFQQQETGAKGKLMDTAEDIKGSLNNLMSDAKGLFGRFGKRT